ncbi:MAG: WG repeat-containing protein [Paludibacteraceae bacterium]|nr:WG repeat-containing protein [Paludibacteraceae bacterium]
MMLNLKTIILGILLSSFSFNASAKGFTGVDDPEFKKYISAAKQYPSELVGEDAIRMKGGDVTVTFTVNKDGHISDIKPSCKCNPQLLRETRSLFETMPNFEPIIIKGEAQTVTLKTKVNYALNTNEKQREAARPKDYVFIDTLIDDYSRVLVKGKWNFVYKNGTDVFPYNYEYMQHYPDGTVRLRHNDKWGLMNCNNEELIPHEYDELYYYEEGYSRVKRDGRWGLVNNMGKTIVSCRYDTIGLFGMETSFGETFDESIIKEGPVMKDLAFARLGGKCGFINKNGKHVIDCVYDTLLKFRPGYVVFVQNGKKGLVNDLGKTIISARYDDMRYFLSHVALVRTGAFYGLVDELGQSVIPCKYDSIMRFENSTDVLLVKKNGRLGIYDLGGFPIVECAYDSIYADKSKRNTVILVKDGMKDENTVYYETATKVDDPTKLIRFEQNNLYGLLTPDSKTIYVNPIYEFIDVFYNGLAIVKKNGKWGMINNLGKEVVEPQYDYINPYSCGFARIAKGDKVGFLNDQFKEAISPSFNHAYPFKDGLAMVNKKHYIDTNGKKSEKLVEGIVSVGACSEVPNFMKEVFPGYECISLYPGDECNKPVKKEEKQEDPKK